MDDLSTAKIMRIADLRYHLLIKLNQTPPGLKAKIKKIKAVEDEKKVKVKN